MSHPDWIGRTLGGRYRLEALVGQGGMAAVYRGYDPNLNRPVAVKLIHSHLSADPNFVRRFEAEAEAVAQLRHPNIIQVHDFSHDGPTYYMVLEYLPGQTLHARLASLSETGARLPLAEAASITATIAGAVHYAHERGLVHRDLKPANIMLEPDGRAILMDFGIAKIADTTGITATGNVLGTAKYLAPELVLGQDPSPRADIYSLGITLFEMVAGEPPFGADSAMQLMLQHVNQPLPDLRALNPAAPPELVAVVERALAKDPAQRYASAEAMAAALRGQASTLANAPLPASVPPAALPRPNRDNEATVADHPAARPAPPQPPSQPAPSSAPPALPLLPGRPAPAPLPAAPSRPANAPRPAAGRRPNWLVPLMALAAAAFLLVCLLATASGGLFGLARLRDLAASPVPTGGLAAERYAHPSGAFTFSLPFGWLVREEDTGVFAYPLDGSALLHVAFTNTGVPLSPTALAAFVNTIETNYYGRLSNYQSSGLTTAPDGRLTVLKTVEDDNGTPQTIFSQVWREGTIVYEQHVWVPTRDYDRLADSVLEIAATTRTDPATAAAAPPYAPAYLFTSPDGQFEFMVPFAWAYRTYDNADGHVDEFASPDETTFIGSVTYTAEQSFTATEAASFAAYLLEAYYAADLQISAEETSPDGRVRLDWQSPARSFEGVSYYETHGERFSMLTWTVPAALRATYIPIWDRAVSTWRLR